MELPVSPIELYNAAHDFGQQCGLEDPRRYATLKVISEIPPTAISNELATAQHHVTVTSREQIQQVDQAIEAGIPDTPAALLERAQAGNDALEAYIRAQKERAEALGRLAIMQRIVGTQHDFQVGSNPRNRIDQVAAQIALLPGAVTSAVTGALASTYLPGEGPLRQAAVTGTYALAGLASFAWSRRKVFGRLAQMGARHQLARLNGQR